MAKRSDDNPDDITTPVDGMDITEMLRDGAYTSLALCREAAGEIDFLRTQIAEMKDKAKSGAALT